MNQRGRFIYCSLLGLLTILMVFCLSPQRVWATERVHDDLGILSTTDINHMRAVNAHLLTAGSKQQVWVYIYKHKPSQLHFEPGLSNNSQNSGLSRYRKQVLRVNFELQQRFKQKADQGVTTGITGGEVQQDKIYKTAAEIQRYISILFVFPYKGHYQIAFAPAGTNQAVLTDFQMFYTQLFLSRHKVSPHNIQTYFNRYTAMVGRQRNQTAFNEGLRWRQVGIWLGITGGIWLLYQLANSLWHQRHPDGQSVRQYRRLRSWLVLLGNLVFLGVLLLIFSILLDRFYLTITSVYPNLALLGCSCLALLINGVVRAHFTRSHSHEQTQEL
ncbi:MAG: hypothetical protein LKF36_03555 [Lactobacillus sp.]|jgi:hypothetical protein|nr:hypothetical protein [Lactobacillus sp.]